MADADALHIGENSPECPSSGPTGRIGMIV
jgi:hypothetical protein